ncbi:helicase C-terminal domain-containing protein [Methanobrevibacter curvatus]|uniref:Bifunctional ATP-dependent DNA helicase/DNA polymerase III subunit epsilon n=1 Tax=Methanobrevibacter curvatus TaxID=49547 RepID=A0A166EIN8_9EURY|nr:ATP-dependent DNA helicase [Methanobrevibacter curvatus]KZX16695.1 bifunctional ATP-dependent DNA helicase/DNA polymerase III subunit epsilon [Methanobrevibacter curvatus]
MPSNKSYIPSKEDFNRMKEEYSHIDEDILLNFPFKTPRKGQLETISKINKAIEKGYKFIMLEAGTGTGKSVMAATIANLYKDTYILTVTKQLQNQYLNDFSGEGFVLAKGRGNFQCKYKVSSSDKNDFLNMNCDSGSCVYDKSLTCEHGLITIYDEDRAENYQRAYGNNFWRGDSPCHYLKQKTHAISSDIVIMNYAYALYMFNYSSGFEKRELMILDEAHNIEDQIMKFVEVIIPAKTIEREINVKTDENEVNIMNKNGKDAWISFLNTLIRKYMKYESEYISKNKSKKGQEEYEAKLTAIDEKIKDYSELISHFEDDFKNWVIYWYDDEILFKPIKIDTYSKDILFSRANVCLLMSATILDHESLAKWLGIEKDEYIFIQEDSPFEKEKRPIIYDLVGRLNYNQKHITTPKANKKVEEILEKHKNEKGIIHTNSYEFQKSIVDNIKNSRLMYHYSKNREDILKKFKNDRSNKVLVSPSLSEGVDLPYDDCRFQIIYKIPFPNLGDAQIKSRKNLDEEWYDYKTIISLAQAYGRIMRAEDDEGTTYVLDSSVNNINSPKFKKFVPEFFKEAIIHISSNNQANSSSKYTFNNSIDHSKVIRDLLNKEE